MRRYTLYQVPMYLWESIWEMGIITNGLGRGLSRFPSAQVPQANHPHVKDKRFVTKIYEKAVKNGI